MFSINAPSSIKLVGDVKPRPTFSACLGEEEDRAALIPLFKSFRRTSSLLKISFLVEKFKYSGSSSNICLSF